MAYVGKVFPSLTRIEIDEDGNIWLTLNNIGDTVIEELQAVAKGYVTVEVLPDDIDDYYEEDDPLSSLWHR